MRNTTPGSLSEILRTVLRRGKFFKGATGVHDVVEVHRAALRAAAMQMRKVRYKKNGWGEDMQ